MCMVLVLSCLFLSLSPLSSLITLSLPIHHELELLILGLKHWLTFHLISFIAWCASPRPSDLGYHDEYSALKGFHYLNRRNIDIGVQ